VGEKEGGVGGGGERKYVVCGLWASIGKRDTEGVGKNGDEIEVWEREAKVMGGWVGGFEEKVGKGTGYKDGGGGVKGGVREVRGRGWGRGGGVGERGGEKREREGRVRE